MRTPVPAFVRPVVQMYRHEVPSPVGPFFIYANAKGEVCCANWAEYEKHALQSLTDRFFKSCDVVVHRETPAADAPGTEAARLLREYFAFHGGQSCRAATSATELPASVFAAFADHARKGEPVAAGALKRRRDDDDGGVDGVASSIRGSLDALREEQEAMEALLRRVPIALGPDATPFQCQVWRTLQTEVPSGAVTTYQALGELAAQKGKRKAASGGSSARAVGSAMHDNPLCVLVPCHRVLAANLSLNGYGCGLYRKVWLLRHERAQGVPAEKLQRVEKEMLVTTPESRR